MIRASASNSGESVTRRTTLAHAVWAHARYGHVTARTRDESSELPCALLPLSGVCVAVVMVIGCADVMSMCVVMDAAREWVRECDGVGAMTLRKKNQMSSGRERS